MAEKTNKGGLIGAMTFKQGAVPFMASWIGVVFVVGVLWQVAFMAGLVQTSALSMAGAGTGYNPQTAPESGASNQLPNCGDQMPIAQMLTYYFDPNNNNQYTRVSTTSWVYMAGAPTALSSVTTNASGIAPTTSGDLSCGSTVREIAGDGGTTYYYARTSDFVVDNSVVPAPNDGKGLEMIPSGAAILYVKDPTNNFGSTLTYNWTAGGFANGSTNSGNLVIKVQAPTTPNMFGDLGLATCFRYNSGNFTSVSAIGGRSVSMAHVKSTATLDTVSCFEFNPLALGENKEIALSLKGASTGPQNGTTMDIILVDKTNELYNGYLIPDENAAAGVVSNGYDLINTPNTGTGRADVTTSSAYTFTR